VFDASDRYSTPVEAISELLIKNVISRDFLIVNGDLLTECNTNELIDCHYINQNLIRSVCHTNQISKLVLATEDQSNNIISETSQDNSKSKGFKLRSSLTTRHKSFEVKIALDFAVIFMV
jgi:hypothetical protein